ncbi:hypothetical protein BR93DRAFT_601573 [Coniochaeta sp. PMI_546]|nr:hypothetical protein BR93DRAFT_601573 [Coniochaeta sp. PMI_546]
MGVRRYIRECRDDFPLPSSPWSLPLVTPPLPPPWPRWSMSRGQHGWVAFHARLFVCLHCPLVSPPILRLSPELVDPVRFSQTRGIGPNRFVCTLLPGGYTRFPISSTFLFPLTHYHRLSFYSPLRSFASSLLPLPLTVLTLVSEIFKRVDIPRTPWRSPGIHSL